MSSLLSRSAVASAILALGLTGAAPQSEADPQAAIAPAGPKALRASFERFAHTWMGKLQKAAARNRDHPKTASGANGVTYRGYGTDFDTELRATGRPAFPYLGILHYQELLYACSDAQATRCRITTTTPVTELFRYENGRWVY